MNIYINGVYTTKFGERWGDSLESLGCEAINGAINNSHMAKENIEALYVGNMLSGIFFGQEHLGTLFNKCFPKPIPGIHVESACASGGIALNSAINSVLCGRYETVAVLGVEKMTDYKTEFIAKALMGAASDRERKSGITFPGLYAIMARAFMGKYNITEKDMAEVSVRNHYYAAKNPKAQFHNLITVDDVMKSGYIADPLKLLDCSPVSDGASCVIISSRRQKKSIEIAASEIACDSLDLMSRASLTSLEATTISSTLAYEKSGIGPEDIDVAEVHDCFSIAQIMAVNDLRLKNKTLINTSGGLKGAGHPVGATGIKQIVEIVDQLNNEAGDRQVKNASVGLTQNVGGSGATAVIHILKKI